MKLLKLIALSSLVLSLAACAPAVSGSNLNPIPVPTERPLDFKVNQGIYLKGTTSTALSGIPVSIIDSLPGFNFTYDEIYDKNSKTASINSSDFSLSGLFDELLTDKSKSISNSAQWVFSIQSVSVTRKPVNIMSGNNQKTWRYSDTINVVFLATPTAPTTTKDTEISLQLQYKNSGYSIISFKANVEALSALPQAVPAK
jgi:hypothetical protein